MFRHLLRRPHLFSAVFAAPKVDEVVSTIGDNQTKTKGWPKVYEIFTVNEDGEFSPQMNTIIQTTFYTAFFGGCYGGFVQSREAYLRFMERNQATEFADHFEAKKKLQDFVTINFAKGALKWGWRLALFGGLYVTFVTVLSSYFGDPSVWHFGVGGLLSGAIYRVNLGLRGVIIGGTLGSLIGLFAGAVTMTILRLTGTSMDEVQEWHHEIVASRTRNIMQKSNSNEMAPPSLSEGILEDSKTK